MSFADGAVAKYGEQLARLGMTRASDREYVGTPFIYPGAASRPTIRIKLVDGFPYRRPQVSVDEPEFTAQSWHLNVDEGTGRGYLCLYGHDGSNSSYPWGNARDLFDRIEEWFANDVAGWPDDPPVLDLHSYLPLTYDALVIHPSHLELDQGLYVRRRSAGSGVLYHVWETLLIDQRQRPLADHWLAEPIPAYCLDLGEVTQPPRSIAELLDVGTSNALDILRPRLAAGPAVLICRYRRGGNDGLLGLHVSEGEDGRDPHAYAFRHTYAMDPELMTLRSGPLARVLADTTIAVIGCGAVGSFLVDALVRGGAANIDMYDSDTLGPGNCVRHLCGPRQVGFSKAQAVLKHLDERAPSEDRMIRAFPGVTRPVDFEQIVAKHWLTIDATADETATGLAIDAATSANANLVSVCVLGAGEYARVDRWPLRGDTPHPESPILMPPTGAPIYEAGCGDPISPTPPYAAQYTAALACKMVMDSVSGSFALPDTLLERIA
jgi:hypothetical protein